MLEYNDFINESNIDYDIISISKNTTGIDDIIIWIGSNKYKNNTIKISNDNKIKTTNYFVVTIPDFKLIDGKIEISDNVYDKIKKFILKNIDIINDYYNNEIIPSRFIKSLKPV